MYIIEDNIVYLVTVTSYATIKEYAGMVDEVRSISDAQEQNFKFSMEAQDWLPVGEPWDKPIPPEPFSPEVESYRVLYLSGDLPKSFFDTKLAAGKINQVEYNYIIS